MGRAFEYRKARKFKRWNQMSKVFSKIGKEIAIAVKESGPSPETNSKLRALIANARAANMPKDNVDRAIKKAASKDSEDYKELVYEGKGPHGIAIIVECTTDNPNRTVASVRSYFTRSGGQLLTTGALDFLFDQKSVFRIKAAGVSVEDLELELIDYGADEVFAEEDNVVIYGGFADFKAIQDFLESKAIEIVSAEFERLPVESKALNAEQQADVDKLLEKFEDDEDVSNVYHNMAYAD